MYCKALEKWIEYEDCEKYFHTSCSKIDKNQLFELASGVGAWYCTDCKIERKAMIRNRYNYPTPPIRDIKGKETQTRNNWTLMETSLAESQTDSYFPTKWPNGYPKQKDESNTHIQRQTTCITKINHDRRTALEWSVKSISLGGLN